MGFGKLDGRGGDPLINAFPSSFTGQSWWGLSSIANNGGNQQNPRFIQLDTGSSNITLYKITLRNSPLFHISTTGAVSNFTAWDIKIITPTISRNTDGIDPGNAQNFTITRSWISDGDDNIAVGAASTLCPPKIFRSPTIASLPVTASPSAASRRQA
jgi:polygalacturonase